MPDLVHKTPGDTQQNDEDTAKWYALAFPLVGTRQEHALWFQSHLIKTQNRTSGAASEGRAHTHGHSLKTNLLEVKWQLEKVWTIKDLKDGAGRHWTSKTWRRGRNVCNNSVNGIFLILREIGGDNGSRWTWHDNLDLAPQKATRPSDSELQPLKL